MKVLLLGSKGYLGSHLLNRFSDVDISPICHKYDYVINCIAKPDLEFCEKNPSISRVSNCDVLRGYLSMGKIISFSSYYVYDDIGTCNEKSNTTREYVYTRDKLDSEKLVTDNGGVVFRLGKLFGGPINKQRKLTEMIIKGKCNVLDMVRFNPTSLEQVADAVDFEIRYGNMSGVYNLCNLGNVTHAEYGEFIYGLLNREKDFCIIDKCRRQFNNYNRCLMSTEKIEKLIYLRKWEIDMEEYIRRIYV